MARTVVNHILATMRLKALNTAVFAGEVSLNSFRIGTVGVADSVPGYSDGTVTLNSFSVNDASTSSTTTHFNKEQGWTGDSGAAGGNVTDGDQDAIAEAIWTFWNSIRGLFTDQYTLGDVRLYPVVGATGRTATAPCIYVPTAVISGGSNTGWIPQQACVVSWDTAARGRRGHGKAYLGPITGVTLRTDGTLQSSSRDTFGNAAVALQTNIRAIGSIASERYYGMVWQRNSDQGAVIGGVRVGDEMDIQQRRRRQRAEVYSTYALP